MDFNWCSNLVKQNVDFNGPLYPVYKQLHNFSLNFSCESFFINRLQVSLTTMQTIFYTYHVCKQFILSFQALQTICQYFHIPLQKDNGPSLQTLRKPQHSRLRSFASLIINNDGNLYTAVFMPNIIKFALQFDKMVKNK